MRLSGKKLQNATSIISYSLTKSKYINNSNIMVISTLNMLPLHGNHKKIVHKKWLKVLGQIVMHNPSAPVIFYLAKSFFCGLPFAHQDASLVHHSKEERSGGTVDWSFISCTLNTLLPSYSIIVYPVKMEYDRNQKIFSFSFWFKWKQKNLLSKLTDL